MSAGVPLLRTERLVLRGWRPGDEAPFAALNADPEVARFVTGRPMTRDESEAFVDKIREHWAGRGYGLWAVEEGASSAFLGYVGLSHHRWYPDDVEIGWRLARSWWGRGLATEGAAAIRDFAFGTIGLDRLISIIHRDNLASRRVAEKIGLTVWKEAVHPKPNQGTPLPIVVYAGARGQSRA